MLHHYGYKSSAFGKWHNTPANQTTIRMPEFTAPGLGKHSNTVTIDIEVGQDASGVLYALGGASEV